MIPVLKPSQCIRPRLRACSTFMQRSITTRRPPSSAIAPPSALITLYWHHSAFAPIFTARRAEDVDDVDRERDLGQRRIAGLAEDRLLARVHRNDAVAVAAQIEADEVARAQLARGKTDDRDRPRAREYRQDRERILPPVGDGGLTQAFTGVRIADTARRPTSRSSIRSSTDSRPTERRIVPAEMPAAVSSSSESWRCVVLAGWMTRLFASPTLARWLHSESASMNWRPASRPPGRSKEKIAPAPSGRYLRARLAYGLDARPG